MTTGPQRWQQELAADQALCDRAERYAGRFMFYGQRFRTRLALAWLDGYRGADTRSGRRIQQTNFERPLAEAYGEGRSARQFEQAEAAAAAEEPIDDDASEGPSPPFGRR